MANKKKHRVVLKPVFLDSEPRSQISDAEIDAAIVRFLRREELAGSRGIVAGQIVVAKRKRSNDRGWVTAKHIKKASSGKRSKASRAHAS